MTKDYKKYNINLKLLRRSSHEKNEKIIIIGAIIATISIGSFKIFKNMNSRIYELQNDSMYGLPKGEYITESTSPNGTYIIKTYLCNGGATVDWSVRGELIQNSKDNKSKNIYWDYHTKRSDITWKDDDTVVINGKEIDLPDGKYDFR